MNLFSRYNKINITATVLVLLVSSICYYFMIRYLLLEQLDDALKVEEQEIRDYIKANNSLPNASSYKDQQVSFNLSTTNSTNRAISTIDQYDSTDKELIQVRQLLLTVKVAGKFYDVIIRKSQKETEDLIQMIVLISMAILILLLLIVFFINRFLLSSLWKPYQSTLQQIKQFNLTGKNDLKFEHTSIHEFTELNKAVSIMTRKVMQEYNSLIQFTENASHEMQTPLAIINSKLDLLVQDESINEQQMLQLQGIYDALNRLSKLNRSLLLLTKIENNQFSETEPINIEKLIREKIDQFEELIETNQLTIKTDLSPLELNYNKQLLDILFSNILSNAIRYSIKGNSILVSLSNNELTISNVSSIPALDEQKIFQRFYRHPNTGQEGNGLGLSIVKQICIDAGFSFGYRFIEGRHEFHVHF